MTKQQTMEAWERLPHNTPILPHFVPMPYKAKGSRYGTCGIRIDGTPAFVDAVLSHLHELLDGENDETRLVLSRNAVGEFGDHDFCNKEEGAEVCYIRLQERGDQAQIARAFMNGLRKRAS